LPVIGSDGCGWVWGEAASLTWVRRSLGSARRHDDGLGVPACGVAAAQSVEAVRVLRGRSGLTGSWRELAAVVSPLDGGAVPGVSRAPAEGHRRGSDDDERVVAEVGEDVAGLADDLAGFARWPRVCRRGGP